MNAIEFLQMTKGNDSNKIGVMPDHPMKKKWQEICEEIKPHYYGEVPKALGESFPNEDPTILKYRLKIFQPVTQPIMLQAMDDIYRMLSNSKFSIDYVNERMRLLMEEFKVNGLKLTDFIFRLCYPRRVIDPNAVLVWCPTGIGVDDNRFPIELKGEIIAANRIVHKGESHIVYENSELGSETKYFIATDEFFGRIIRRKNADSDSFIVDYEHGNSERKIVPFVTLGGRPIVITEQKTNKEYIVYLSDFLAALPHLNRYAVQENQEVSVALSSAFPHKFLKGTTCTACQGRGQVLPEEIDSNNPDKTVSCKKCKGHGKTFPSSPLNGYFWQDMEGATQDEKLASVKQLPIQFSSPDVQILDKITALKDASRKRAEDVLNVRRASEFTESGIAKEKERESLYTQLGRISEQIFGQLIFESLNIIQAIVLTDFESAITVNMPTSFDIKTEMTLLEEFIESLKGTPINLRYKTYMDFIKRRFHGDKTSHQISKLCVEYAPLYLYTIDERESLVSTGGIAREESIKAALVFNWLMIVASENRIDIMNPESKTQIFARLDEIKNEVIAARDQERLNVAEADSFNNV